MIIKKRVNLKQKSLNFSLKEQNRNSERHVCENMVTNENHHHIKVRKKWNYMMQIYVGKITKCGGFCLAIKKKRVSGERGIESSPYPPPPQPPNTKML